MVTAHQRVLNVWEQASIARREQDGMDHAAMGKVAQPRLSPRLSVVLIWVGMRFARAMQGGTVSRL
ncbi:TPA: hypothetical protein ACH3X3_002755 [Trebouxia sp. C0006]